MAKTPKTTAPGLSEAQAPFEPAPAPPAHDAARPAREGAPEAKGSAATGFGEPAGKWVVGAGGRVVIPADVRGRLGIKEGDALVATLADGELRLMSLATAVQRAQALVAPFRPTDGTRVSDELIAERRREATREAS